MELTLGGRLLAELPDDIAHQLLALAQYPGQLDGTTILAEPVRPVRTAAPLGGGSRFYQEMEDQAFRLSIPLVFNIRTPGRLFEPTG